MHERRPRTIIKNESLRHPESNEKGTPKESDATK